MTRGINTEQRRRRSEDVFDFESFWKDVELYRQRHNLHVEDLADMTDMDESNVRDAYKYKKVVGLFFICKMCVLCDLSIDKYNFAKVHG